MTKLIDKRLCGLTAEPADATVPGGPEQSRNLTPRQIPT
jgi:hypothetical protein